MLFDFLVQLGLMSILFLSGFFVGQRLCYNNCLIEKFSLLRQNTKLSLQLMNLAGILNYGTYAQRKEIKPVIIFKGQKYSILIDSKGNWEIKKTRNLINYTAAFVYDLTEEEFEAENFFNSKYLK